MIAGVEQVILKRVQLLKMVVGIYRFQLLMRYSNEINYIQTRRSIFAIKH